jgi:hypothetical protein
MIDEDLPPEPEPLPPLMKPKGSWWDEKRQKFQVKATLKGKRVTLGYYENPYEADAVYRLAVKEENARKEKTKHENTK